jgi:hypothetical protein
LKSGKSLKTSKIGKTGRSGSKSESNAADAMQKRIDTLNTRYNNKEIDVEALLDA